MRSGFSRRDFLLNSSLAAMGVSLYGCSKGGGSSGSPPSAPFVPRVNSPPFFPLDIFSSRKSSSLGLEVVTFDLPGGGSRRVRCVDPSVRGDIDFSLFESFDSDSFVVGFDSRDEYFPSIASFNASPESGILDLWLKGIAQWGNWSGTIPGNQYVPLNQDIVMSPDRWNVQVISEGFSRTPRNLYYLGRHSWEDVKLYQKAFLASTAFAAFVAPNHFSATAYAFASNTGVVVDVVDDIIDEINNYWGAGTINTSQDYDVYMPTPLGSLDILFNDAPLLIASSTTRDGSDVDIRRLYPLHPGTTWRYSDGLSPLSVSAQLEENVVEGKDFISVVEPGSNKTFLGFDGDVLKVHGVYSPLTGNILFDGAVTVGDRFMNIGRRFVSSSRVVVPNHPNIEGMIETAYDVVDRRQVSTNQGDFSFGDCFVVDEHTQLYVHNRDTGVSASDSFVGTRYLAENVGPVKLDLGSRSFDIVGLENHSLSLESRLGRGEVSSSFSRFIDACKKVL